MTYETCTLVSVAACGRQMHATDVDDVMGLVRRPDGREFAAIVGRKLGGRVDMFAKEGQTRLFKTEAPEALWCDKWKWS